MYDDANSTYNLFLNISKQSFQAVLAKQKCMNTKFAGIKVDCPSLQVIRGLAGNFFGSKLRHLLDNINCSIKEISRPSGASLISSTVKKKLVNFILAMIICTHIS